MPSDGPIGQRSRLLAMSVLVVALFGMFVWSGTSTYDPSQNDFPDEKDVALSPDAFVGERVTLGGEVVETNPVVVQIWHVDDPWAVTLESAETALVRRDEISPGEEITAHGELIAGDRLATDRAFTRESWETTYMYVISIVGAFWVLGRAMTGWRVDRNRLAFVLRENPEPVPQRGPDETPRSERHTTQHEPTDESRGERDG